MQQKLSEVRRKLIEALSRLIQVLAKSNSNRDGKGVMSPAHRRRISEAMTAKWAERKARQGAEDGPFAVDQPTELAAGAVVIETETPKLRSRSNVRPGFIRLLKPDYRKRGESAAYFALYRDGMETSEFAEKLANLGTLRKFSANGCLAWDEEHGIIAISETPIKTQR